ncbi:MAG: NUDIX domain-containing protein [Rhodobacteraceae bacterium]|nr:NUDIX domain-containing protein [Paracoccaceae bacterium]
MSLETTAPLVSEQDGFADLGALTDAHADATPPDNMPSAALTALWESEGRILCQRRDDKPGVLYRGTWSIFGGGVEPGETRREAGVRELEEETGLRLALENLLPFRRFLSPFGKEINVFRARRRVAPEEISLREGAGFGFLTRAQIETYRFIPYVGEALRAHFDAPLE